MGVSEKLDFTFGSYLAEPRAQNLAIRVPSGWNTIKVTPYPETNTITICNSSDDTWEMSGDVVLGPGQEVTFKRRKTDP